MISDLRMCLETAKGKQATLFIRKETYENELRCALTPHHAHMLIHHGYKVYVESSDNRIYPDSDYKASGAIITKNSWISAPPSSLIIGIKELSELDKLKGHKHLYFSHSFKNQKESSRILSSFRESNSVIYDLEYFTDSQGKRLIAFGFHAGLVAASLGILQYHSKRTKRANITQLKPWASFDTMLKEVVDAVPPHGTRIAVIGGEGRVGKGIRHVLDTLNLKYTILTRELDQCGLSAILPTYSIIYNAIQLDEDYKEVWFSSVASHIHDPITIVDVSCDYSRPNNPLPIYTQPTTWLEPVYTPSSIPNVNIIAIENLPSLLPKESSDYFSEKLYPMLLDYNNLSETWKKPLDVFYEKSNKKQ